MARASAFQAEGRRFESGFPLHLSLGSDWWVSGYRPRSSVVEHFLGKEEVIGSIPIVGSRFPWVVPGVFLKRNLMSCDPQWGWSSGAKVEWKIMRVIVQLACSDCNRKNYSGTKNKKTTTQRLEFKKYCRFCRKHTPHKETK